VPTTLAEVFRHNLWANTCMLDVCAGLTEEQLDASETGTYGRIRDTLVHLVAAEERYVTRLTDGPAPPLRERQEFPGLELLRSISRQSGEALIEIADRMEPGTILRGTWRGEPYEMPATIVLTQAINHATEHRSHINTVLTHLGIQPPELDAWAYNSAQG
jgi:uncharacterized damage-inducible protein DinB